MNDIDKLKNAQIPPTFYSWGSKDNLAPLIKQNVTALQMAGVIVDTHIVEGFPHGYGTGGDAEIWVKRFDEFLCRNLGTKSKTIY